jgi:quinol monooxygenase YgiN
MSALRVLHQLVRPVADDAQLIGAAQATRSEPGCLEAECYRNIEQPQQLAVVELWADQWSFSEYWSRRLLEEGQDAPLRSSEDAGYEHAATEFYAYALFHRPDRAWQPIESRENGKIFWPASNGVRILSQAAASNLEEWIPWGLSNARETRREPGCLQFDHLQSIEFPEHVLLLELWQPPQSIYDAHWQLRLKSNANALGIRREPVPRRLGTAGIEFYRYQRFVHLYDRWLPAEVDRWSETILWPD